MKHEYDSRKGKNSRHNIRVLKVTQSLLAFFAFAFLTVHGGMWDLSSRTRDQTLALCNRGTES